MSRMNLFALAAGGEETARQRYLGLGLLSEELTNEAKPEVEYVVYAKISDFGILHQATGSEAQEQWELKIPALVSNGGGGRVRVRKTSGKEGISYALTFKLRKSPSDQNGVITPQVDLSHAIACDQQALEMFKIFAESGMIKERYFFPTDHGLTWEVDVFLRQDGTRHEWVKIDLELKDGMTPLSELPKLPAGFTEAILNQHGKRTAEEEQKIQTLYSTMFTTPNIYGKPIEQTTPKETEDDVKKVVGDLGEDGS